MTTFAAVTATAGNFLLALGALGVFMLAVAAIAGGMLSWNPRVEFWPDCVCGGQVQNWKCTRCGAQLLPPRLI